LADSGKGESHNRGKPARLRLLKLDFQLGELLPSVSSQLPLSATVTAIAAVGAFLLAVLQSDRSSDDDDSGPGDGGLMQPVGMGA
jgi:hypothetical protein